jgi:hypothetical protein
MNVLTPTKTMTYIFTIYQRDEFWDWIPSTAKIVKVRRAKLSSAEDYLYRKYPKTRIELKSTEL